MQKYLPTKSGTLDTCPVCPITGLCLPDTDNRASLAADIERLEAFLHEIPTPDIQNSVGMTISLTDLGPALDSVIRRLNTVFGYTVRLGERIGHIWRRYDMNRVWCLLFYCPTLYTETASVIPVAAVPWRHFSI